jgi:hypothetical protein
MKLIEISIIKETLLENEVEKIKALLSHKLEETDLEVFSLMDIAVTEKENDKGNYMLYTRIVLEYPNQMIKDEVESYADKVKEEIIYLLDSLLSSKNNHFASRSSITKLI